MITDALFLFFDWVSSLFSSLNSMMITPSVSVFTLIVSVSIISMLITSFISRGHE